MTPQQEQVAKGLGAVINLFEPYIKGAYGAPRFGTEVARGAAESAASALETADRPAEWLLGRDESPYSPRGIASKIRGLAPEAPPPAQGFQQKASDVLGQVIGAAPVGIGAWQGGVPWATLSGQGVAESVAASKGQKATGWEKFRDSLVEGGQRAFMGWVMRQPWGSVPGGFVTSGLAGAAGAGAASEAEGRGHESAAVDAGLNFLFGLIGPSMSPADRAKIADAQEKAKAGDFRAFDAWWKDPKNAEHVGKVAKALAKAARDRGYEAPAGEKLPLTERSGLPATVDGTKPPSPTEPPIPPVPAGKRATSADDATAWSRAAAETATQITHMDRGNAIWRSVVTPEMENMWRGVPDNERIRVMSDYMRGNLENVPPHVKQFFDVAREALDRQWAEEQYAGVESDWRENYWPGLWTEESRAAQMRPQGGGGPGFAKAKVFEDLMEGINAGLTLKHTNPAVYLLSRLEHGELWKSRVENMRAYEKVGVAGRDANIPKDARGHRPFEWTGYDEIDLAGTRYLVHPNAAKVFRRGMRMDKQTISALIGLNEYSALGKGIDKLYDGWMTVRNATVPTKLALSAFHPFHVSSIGAKSEIAGLLAQRLNNRISNQDFIDAMTFSARGRYETGKLDADSFVKRLEDLGVHDRIAQWAMLAGGYTPQRPSIYEIKAEQKLRRLFNDTIPTLEQELNAKNTGTLGQLFHMAPQEARGLALQMGRIIENFQHPVFGDWIPAIKTSAYLNEVSAFLKGHPELMDATEASTIKLKDGLRKVQQSIDNRFGEMDYNKIFMPTMVRKIAVASLLSVGWQLGFLREFGGGAYDIGKNLVGDATNNAALSERTTRSAYALTYTAGALAMGGLATYIMTGTPPEGKDWVYPRLPDGTHINTPLFTREFGAMYFHWQNEGYVAGSAALAANKLVPMVSTLAEIYKNEDYFGHQIYDEHAPLFTQVEQGAKHFGLNTTVPISIESIVGNKIEEPSKIALSLGGFSPAPKYATRSGAESKVLQAYKKFTLNHETPFEAVQRKNDKDDLKASFKKAQTGTPEDKAAYASARKTYLEKYKAFQTNKGLKQAESHWARPKDYGMFAQQEPEEQLALLNEMTIPERESHRWAAKVVIRDKFPMVDEETYRHFTADEQKSAIDAAPKKMKQHYLEMSSGEVRRAYGLDPRAPPPSAPWELKSRNDSGMTQPKPKRAIPAGPIGQAPWEQKTSSDYDYEGFKKSGMGKGTEGHYPDTFKLPNHMTFSTDSKYSTPERPGGKWLKDAKGRWHFSPSSFNLKQHSADEMKEYFKKNEPNAILDLPLPQAPWETLQ